jgi:hypothetical protein
VNTTVNGTFHVDQVDAKGKTAFQCFKGAYLQYPDQDLHKILGDFFTV